MNFLRFEKIKITKYTMIYIGILLGYTILNFISTPYMPLIRRIFNIALIIVIGLDFKRYILDFKNLTLVKKIGLVFLYLGIISFLVINVVSIISIFL